jgi:hypothetical protein
MHLCTPVYIFSIITRLDTFPEANNHLHLPSFAAINFLPAAPNHRRRSNFRYVNFLNHAGCRVITQLRIKLITYAFLFSKPSLR